LSGGKRALVYGMFGLTTELAFTGVMRGRPRTSLWVVPVYALLRPLYEPAHDALRGRPVFVRAASYGIGFLAVEYASGRVFRMVRGRAPWDYSYARYNLDGLIRPDFLPLWAMYGLVLEPVHDRLLRRWT
jgi:putative ABC transporter type IV